MTTREFYQKISQTSDSEEIRNFANDKLDKMDKALRNRKAKPSKTAIENAEIKKKIQCFLDNKTPRTATEIGTLAAISTQKASALLVQMAKDGVIHGEPVKVPKHGKQVGYTIA
jgi:predicted ArsR family transcriptional regulator